MAIVIVRLHARAEQYGALPSNIPGSARAHGVTGLRRGDEFRLHSHDETCSRSASCLQFAADQRAHRAEADEPAQQRDRAQSDQDPSGESSTLRRHAKHHQADADQAAAPAFPRGQIHTVKHCLAPLPDFRRVGKRLDSAETVRGISFF